MRKPMSEQMQKVADRYEKATGKKFGQMTNADHIRSMTDEELATILYSVFNIDDLKIPFCKNKPECNELMDADKEIPESMCLRCMLDWLKRPYKEDEFG